MNFGEFLNKGNKYPNGISWNQLKDGFNYFDEVDGIRVGDLVRPSKHFSYAQWVRDLFPLRVEEIYVFKCDGRNDLEVRFSFSSLKNPLKFYTYKDGEYYNNFLSRENIINKILEYETEIQS